MVKRGRENDNRRLRQTSAALGLMRGGMVCNNMKYNDKTAVVATARPLHSFLETPRGQGF
jgi:hypothetical protein